MNVPKKVFGDLHSFNLRISKKQVYYAGHDEAVAGLPSPLSGVCLSGSATCDYESSFPEFHDVNHSSGSILRFSSYILPIVYRLGFYPAFWGYWLSSDSFCFTVRRGAPRVAEGASGGLW